ncbi:MAG: hypothetical protein JRJ87_09915 [Deltaproteobacteria bacterium]|nr:hypothetical protein [Deltaproteobacteria bacterium]
MVAMRYRSVFFLLAALISGGCTNYSSSQDPDPVVVELPHTCKHDFATNFDDPFLVTDGMMQSAAFSPDCTKLITIDAARQRLRVTNLETRTTTELDSDVQHAIFSRDSSKVIYLKFDEQNYKLFIADGEQAHLIDRDVSYALVQSPDGNVLIYMVDYQDQTYMSDMRMVRLDQTPLVGTDLAKNTGGSASFTPDSQSLVFVSDIILREEENPETGASCSWYYAKLNVLSLEDGARQLLSPEVSAWQHKISKDGKQVYSVVDYNCQDQSQTLVSYSLEGKKPIELISNNAMSGWGMDFIEIPEESIIIHMMVFYTSEPEYNYSAEIWATKTDGSGSRTLAQDAMSNMQTCMYFLPFQQASRDKLVYLRKDTSDLVAIDLEHQKSWTVTDTVNNLYYDVSPDARWVLTQTINEAETYDLLLTPIEGGQSRVLMGDMGIAGAYSMPGRSAWTPSSERILSVFNNNDGTPRTLYSIAPHENLVRLIADDVPSEGFWNSYVQSRGGWLVAVQRLSGMTVQLVP